MVDDFTAIWESGAVIRLRGRFDASQAAKAEEALARAEESTEVDFSELVYISSAGIGCLLAAHKKLQERGCSLKLVNMNAHIRELFELAGFDMVFEMG